MTWLGLFAGFAVAYVVGAIIYVRREMRKPPEVALDELFAEDEARLRELEADTPEEEREVEMQVMTTEDVIHALRGNGKAAVIFRKENS